MEEENGATRGKRTVSGKHKQLSSIVIPAKYTPGWRRCR